MLKYEDITRGCVIRFTKELPEELEYNYNEDWEQWSLNEDITVESGPGNPYSYLQVLTYSDDRDPCNSAIYDSDWEQCGGEVVSVPSQEQKDLFEEFDQVVADMRTKAKEIRAKGIQSGVGLDIYILDTAEAHAQWNSSRC